MNSQTNSEKILNLLTMCRRAGRMTLGFDPTFEALEDKKLHVICFSSDLSPKTRKEADFLLKNRRDITILELPFSMEELHISLGKRSGILGICDEGFKKALIKLFP